MKFTLSWRGFAIVFFVLTGCAGKAEPQNAGGSASGARGALADTDASHAGVEAGPSSGSGDALPVEADASFDALPGDEAVDWLSCSGPGDCILAQRGCCGWFFTLDGYAAIRRESRDAFGQAECSSTALATALASGRACDGSITVNDGLAAFCIAGRCKAIVVPQDPISACSTDADCELVTSSCQPGCPYPTGELAIRVDQFATYAQQVCPGSDPQSLHCAPQDAGLSVRGKCGADGHCVSP